MKCSASKKLVKNVMFKNTQVMLVILLLCHGIIALSFIYNKLINDRLGLKLLISRDAWEQ